MALPKQFTEATFRLDKTVDITHTVKIQNSSIDITPEYFSGSSYKESIGGKRISDIRGFRVKINLSYNASSQPSEFRSLFNDLLSAFRDGTDFDGLYISIEGTELSSKFILEDLTYTQSYNNQIGRFVPSITLCSESIVSSIPSNLQGVL